MQTTKVIPSLALAAVCAVTARSQVSFHVTERASLDFHADVYNVLNHPNCANPGTVRLTQTLATDVSNGSHGIYGSQCRSIWPAYLHGREPGGDWRNPADPVVSARHLLGGTGFQAKEKGREGV